MLGGTLFYKGDKSLRGIEKNNDDAEHRVIGRSR
ncbi:hypothetical protein Q674_12180 [Acinetobacter sp. COS3]|nr:hypothetical protein Q674_12180 [Acinetobacter sp. COS3]